MYFKFTCSDINFVLVVIIIIAVFIIIVIVTTYENDHYHNKQGDMFKLTNLFQKKKYVGIAITK